MRIHKEGQLRRQPPNSWVSGLTGKAVLRIIWMAGKLLGCPSQSCLKLPFGTGSRCWWAGMEKESAVRGRIGAVAVFWRARGLSMDGCRKQLFQHRAEARGQGGTQRETGGAAASDSTDAGSGHRAPTWAARLLRDYTLWVHNWGRMTLDVCARANTHTHTRTHTALVDCAQEQRQHSRIRKRLSSAMSLRALY